MTELFYDYKSGALQNKSTYRNRAAEYSYLNSMTDMHV